MIERKICDYCHKDMDKKNNQLNNLVTMCLVCHGKLHGIK